MFPKVAKCRRVGISERMKATRLQRHGAVVCESCYACYDSNGNERPELQLLSEAAEPAVPVLGVDILPGGGTDEG